MASSGEFVVYEAEEFLGEVVAGGPFVGGVAEFQDGDGGGSVEEEG